MTPKKKLRKKVGPVAIVAEKGVKIPIYLSPRRGEESYVVTYYVNGARKRDRLSTIETAKKRAWELVEELSKGTAHVGTLTPKQAAVITEAWDILKPTGVSLIEVARQYADAHAKLVGKGTLADAVKCYLEQHSRTQIVPIKLPELVEKFLLHIKAKGRSRRYCLDMQARLHKAAEAFTGMIGEIDSKAVDAWLIGMNGVSGRTRNNYRAALTTLFSFARQKGHLPRGIQTEAEFSERFDDKGGEIGIYTKAQLEILLSRIDRRMVPFVAIGAFAGLRSAEIVRLEWSEVKFDQGVIEVKAGKAKTASRRLAPILPVLESWLVPFRKSSGGVLESVLDEFALATQFRKAVAAIKDESGGQAVQIVHNGLRHSFITYRMAVLKNAAEVALEAGNSPRMIFQHYRELATEEQGKAWFAIKPTRQRLTELKSRPVKQGKAGQG
jgi:integrase